jgi:hypothetical protein
MADMNFDGLARFIYGAVRHGGDGTDVTDWMADDLGVARLPLGDDSTARELYSAFFAKYADTDSLRENHERFITMLRDRPPSTRRVQEESVPRRTGTPKFIAFERILWLRKDGTEQIIEAKIGEPYQCDAQSWACPASLEGVDGRYPDIVGANSLQSLTLALRLVATRLGHLLADGERLVYPDDRHPWDLSTFSMS